MPLPTDKIRKIIFAANASLAALTVLAVLFVARDAVRLAVYEAPEPQGPAKAVQQREPLLSEYSPILGNNVFGFDAGELYPLQNASPVQEAAVPAPEKADLTVYGTVAWDSGFGYAFIKGPSGRQETVMTGDEIPGTGGVLTRVLANRIVVARGSEEFEVKVVEARASAGSKPSVDSYRPPAPTGNAPPRTGTGTNKDGRTVSKDTKGKGIKDITRRKRRRR